MIAWTFHSSTVWCYMNACTWGLMWSLTFTDEPIQAGGELKCIVGKGNQNSGRPLKLVECISLQTAMRQWCAKRPVNTQQDGAEFCTVVLSRLVGFDWGT